MRAIAAEPRVAHRHHPEAEGARDVGAAVVAHVCHAPRIRDAEAPAGPGVNASGAGLNHPVSSLNAQASKASSNPKPASRSRRVGEDVRPTSQTMPRRRPAPPQTGEALLDPGREIEVDRLTHLAEALDEPRAQPLAEVDAELLAR